MKRVTVLLPEDVLREIDRVAADRGAFVRDAVRRETGRWRRARLRESLKSPHPESAAVAESEFDAWAGALPEEDLSDLVDAKTLTPVRWIEGKGWVRATESGEA